MQKQILMVTMLAALAAANGAMAEEKKVEREKCYGVAKAGRNDCAAKDGKSSCAGNAKKDASPNDWVYTPKGLCDKLVGGIKG